MQLTTNSTPIDATWHHRQPLPTDLPTAPAVTALPGIDESSYAGRVRIDERHGTEPLMLGSNGDGWRVDGSFEQAVAAARDLSIDMREVSGLGRTRGTIAVVSVREGWQLLRAGIANASVDWRERNLDLDRAAGAPVVKARFDGLQALVGPTTWIDLRTAREA